MENPYARKKQPEQVRKNLIEAAVQIAMEQGLSNASLQATATLAGVSKGGLIHHFPTKRALDEGVFLHMIDHVDTEIERWLEKDRNPEGSFTRAYVNTIFAGKKTKASRLLSAISIAMMSDLELNDHWYKWFNARMKKHAATDAKIEYELIRLAADGAWLNFTLDKNSISNAESIRKRLIESATKAGKK